MALAGIIAGWRCLNEKREFISNENLLGRLEERGAYTICHIHEKSQEDIIK